MAMDFVRLDRIDTVVTATRNLALGALVDGVTTTTSIPSGHKVATTPMGLGDPVRKYAQLIGYASCDIKLGDHVHTHNVDFRNAGLEYEFSTDLRPILPAKKQDPRKEDCQRLSKLVPPSATIILETLFFWGTRLYFGELDYFGEPDFF